MGIKCRLLLLVLIAALPVFALTVWSELDHRRRAAAQMTAQVARLADLTASQQDRFIDAARSVLGVLAETAPVQARNGRACSDLFVRTLKGIPAYTGLAAVGTDGVVFCSNNPASVGANLADRDYFQAAMAEGGFVVGAYRIGVVTGAKIVPMAYYADTPEGPVVLVITLNLDRFSSAIDLPTLPEGSVVMVLDRENTILARRPDSGRWIGRVAPPDSALVRGVALGRGVIEGPGLDGEPRVFAFATLGMLGDLVVAVGIPSTFVYSEANRGLVTRLALLLVVFGAAAALALVMGDRFIVRPLNALKITAGRLASGDLQARAGEFGGVLEFAALGRQFNDMADSLERHEVDLRRALESRELLIREASHRVKNSLQMIVGLLRLQSRLVGDEAVTRCLTEAATRIQAVARAHERLYRGERIGMVEVGPYLRALCDDLRNSLDAQPNRPTLVADIAETDLTADRAIPLALIVNELVTNAFKYAYPTGASGSIEVTFEAHVEGRHRLRVADQGIGLPPGFRPEGANSLGMRMVSALVFQLGGQLDIQAGHPGACFTILLPA